MKFNISKLVVKQKTYLIPLSHKWYGNKGQHEQTATNISLCWIVFTYDLDV